MLIPVSAHAAIPTTLGYQGRLTNTAGTAQTGTYSFVFRLYSAASGGVAVWSETQSSVSVSQSAFAVQLGAVSPFPASMDFTTPLYLSTEVNSDGEMSPRVPINAVPYAYTAGGVNASSTAPITTNGGRMYYNTNTGTLNYYDAVAGAWKSAAGGTLDQVTTNGATTTNFIGIGVATATEAFDVAGNIQNILHTGQSFRVATTTAVGSTPQGIVTAGKYAYVALGGSNQLAVLDITDAGMGDSIDRVGTVGVGANPVDVAYGRNIYVVNQNGNSVSIVDASNPASPTVLSTVTVGTSPSAVALASGHIYVTNHGTNTVSIVDVDDSANPSVASSVTVGTSPSSIYASGHFLYVTNEGSNSLSILDITNAENPTIVTTAMGNAPTGIFVSGRYAYIANSGNNTVSIVDVSDPSAPSVVSTATVGTTPNSLVVSGRYLYVTNQGSNSITILDVVNPQQTPTTIGTITVGSSPNHLAINGRNLFVSNGSSGTVTDIDVKGIETNGLVAHSATVGSLQVQTNAHIDDYLSVGGSLSVDGRGIFTSGQIGATRLDISERFLIDAQGVLNFKTQSTEPSAPTATDEMKLFVKDDNGINVFQYIDSGGIVRQMNRDTIFIARNQTGSSIAKGSAVYITGANGETATIGLAKANSTSTVPAMGVTIEAIANAGYGRVLQFGRVTNLNTAAFAVGDQLWVSPTVAGGLTNVEPSAPNISQPLATVLVSHAASGTIQVFSRAPQGTGSGTNLNSWSIGDGLAGVRTLVFQGINATGTLAWTPSGEHTITIPNLDGLMVVSTGTLTNGSIPFVTTGGALGQSNGLFFWDATNSRLGVGTNAPTAALTVSGSSALQVLTFTSGTGTSVTSTNLFATNGTFTNLSVTNPFTLASLTWTYATGTYTTSSFLGVTASAHLPVDTLINSTAVCLLDGTNCPSGTSANFQTVTNSGNTTTRDIQFRGGTSTGAFTVQDNLTVTGTLIFANASGTSATTTNFFTTNGTVSNFSATNGTSTFFYSPIATFTNATSSNLYVSGSLTGSGGNLALARIGNSTFSTIQHLQDIFHSAGWVSGGTFTDLGGGVMSVSAGTGLVRTSNSATATVQFFDWTASSSVVIASGTTRYIGVEYNNGSPQLTSRTSVNWNYKTDFPLGRVVNEAGTLQLSSDVQGVGDHAANMILREYETMPLARDERNGGLLLGETGTRNLTVSAGALWDRLNRYAISAIDTSGASTFDRYYRNGSGFTKEANQTQWPNTQYDDGSGVLATMTANYYAALWFYIQTDGRLIMLYGRNQYASPGSVETEAPPDTVPDRLTASGKLIARLIFKKSAATSTSINSAFDTNFSTTLNFSHANLSSLDYDSSGHTGFAGTGVNNTFTGGNVFANVTSTSATSTNFFATRGTFTNLSVTNPFTLSGLIWTYATGTYTTSSFLGVTTSAHLPVDTLVNNTSVCLQDGTNCPSGTVANFQTVTNAGNTTTRAIQFGGGTSTGAFTVQNNLTVTGTTDLQALTFTNGTSSAWLGFTTASGSSLVVNSHLLVGTSTFDASLGFIGQFESNTNTQSGLKIANFNSGNAASAVTRYYTNTGFTGSIFATSDNYDLFANASSSFGMAAQGSNNLRLSTNGGYLRMSTDPTNPNPDLVILGTGANRGFIGIGTSNPTMRLTVAGGMLATDLIWTNATGTYTTSSFLNVTTQTRLPTDTKINSTSVCLSDGTNCPSSTSANFQTVTNAGNTTTRDIQFNGGTSTGAFTIQNNLTVTGTTALAGLTFTNGTSSNWFGFTTATGSTMNTASLFSAASIFTNATSTNATTTNFFATNAIASALSFVNGTSTSWFGFTTASGTTLNALTVNATGLISPNVTITGGSINGTTIGLTTAADAIFTNVTSTNATTTNLFATNASISGLTFVNGTSTSWFGFATASGTAVNALSLYATNALFQNVTSTNVTSTNIFARDANFTRLIAQNATATNISVTGTLFFSNVTSSINMADTGTISLSDGTNNLLQLKDLSTNFGAALNAGAFIDRNSSIDEEFNKFRTAITADTTGASGAGMGDGGGWGGTESGNCNFSTVADTTNGLMRITSVTAGNGCLSMMDRAARVPNLILAASNLPIALMKVRPSNVSNPANRLFVGMADDTDGAVVDPTDFIGFTENTLGVWTGVAINAGASTTVSCTGQTISTTQFALLMVEVRSTTDVRFFVDNDVSNGVNFTECDGGIHTNIPTVGLAPELIYQARTNGTANSFLDVDFYRLWQDDPKKDKAESPRKLFGELESVEPDYASHSGLVQSFPADDPNMATGTLVSLDPSSDVMKVVPTDRAADDNMVGIVTDDPGLSLANGSYDGVRVITHGRARANVSLENGPIKIGDALTSASATGTVMRATETGPMIGRAVESYTSASAGKSILLLVEPSYYLPADNGSSLFQLETATGTSAALQTAAPAPETLLPAGTRISQAMGVGTLVVRDATFTHAVVVIGTAVFRGPIVFGDTNAGKVKMEPAESDVTVLFPKPYPTVPHVFVTPEVEDLSNGMGYDRNTWDGSFYVTHVTTTGFGIRIPRVYCPNVRTADCPIGLWFNWFVAGFEEPKEAPTSPPAGETAPEAATLPPVIEPTTPTSTEATITTETPPPPETITEPVAATTTTEPTPTVEPTPVPIVAPVAEPVPESVPTVAEPSPSEPITTP